MLLFNGSFVRGDTMAILFQNISCYCLTVFGASSPDLGKRFQNISCYCLTEIQTLFSIIGYKFQNISCYCLTNPDTAIIFCQTHFKTSHVIV